MESIESMPSLASSVEQAENDGNRPTNILLNYLTALQTRGSLAVALFLLAY